MAAAGLLILLESPSPGRQRTCKQALVGGLYGLTPDFPLMLFGQGRIQALATGGCAAPDHPPTEVLQ